MQRIDSSQSALRPFDRWPVEMFYRCLSFMHLDSLILCRLVCKDWRRLTDAYVGQGTDLRRLLELFEAIAKSPSRPTRADDGRRHSEPFDRQAYIASLLSADVVIPDIFRLWLLEWPGYLVRPDQWPSSPPIPTTYSPTTYPFRCLPDYHGPEVTHILPIYDDFERVWLILDEDPQKFGRVLALNRKLDRKSEEAVTQVPIQVYGKYEIFEDWLQYQFAVWQEADGIGHVKPQLLSGGDFDGDEVVAIWQPTNRITFTY